MRLRGGFGTLCDPIHSGFVEVLHFGDWGSICQTGDNQVAEVVCRQLGFTSGAVVDALNPIPPRDSVAPQPTADYESNVGSSGERDTEEAEEPVERFWLSEVTCGGRESELIDCNLGKGFRRINAGCDPELAQESTRLHVACQRFSLTGSPKSTETIPSEGGECLPQTRS